jgi:ketosteroid isomerase-like protein
MFREPGMTDLMVAEFTIRQLHARYLDAVWRKDFEAFGDCFAEDAEWRIGGRILRGRAEIVGNLKRLMPNFQRVLMNFRTPLVHIEDGALASRTYVTEQNAFLNGRPGNSIGIYFERFVKQADQLRFKWRLFQLHYIGKMDITTPLFENPDFGPPPAMPPLDAPTYDHSGLSTD